MCLTYAIQFYKGRNGAVLSMKHLSQQQLPYICTPITGSTKEAVLSQLHTTLKTLPDMIEWRADFLQELNNTELVLQIIKDIKSQTDLPLLFTIRAQHEGGEKIALTEEEIVELLQVVCEQSAVEMIDFETSNLEKHVIDIRKVSKKHEKKLILSYHNFSETPSDEALLHRAEQAQSLGADIAKFAVMPRDKEDVYQLLQVTKELDDRLEIPIVTMSMGEMGAISRVIGWAFGS